MRRGKLHYNADRWFAYCADRMGWQIGHWIESERLRCDAAVPPGAGLVGDLRVSSSPINGERADAVEAATSQHGRATDAAHPTPSVWRRRK